MPRWRSVATARREGAGAVERRSAGRHDRGAGAADPRRANPLRHSGASVQPGTYYPGGGITAITLNGADVTGQLRGGRIGANIALRDMTLPTDQAELDEFAQNLASRFDAQGLTLFTDPTGTVPAGRTAAGADRLCRLRQHHPGEPGGARRHHWCAMATFRRTADRLRRLHRHHQRGAELTFGANRPPAFRGRHSERPRPHWHSQRTLCRADHAAAASRPPTRLTGAGQRHASTQARHRAGGADNAYQQAFGPERLLENFLLQVAGAQPTWTAAAVIDEQVERIRAQVGSERVLCGLSGGVDSAVAALLVHRAVGDQLTCVFVDHGLLRKDEAAQRRQDVRRPLPRRARARRCGRPLPHPPRRRHRSGGEAAADRRGLHPRLRGGGCPSRRRALPRPGDAQPYVIESGGEAGVAARIKPHPTSAACPTTW